MSWRCDRRIVLLLLSSLKKVEPRSGGVFFGEGQHAWALKGYRPVGRVLTVSAVPSRVGEFAG